MSIRMDDRTDGQRDDRDVVISTPLSDRSKLTVITVCETHAGIEFKPCASSAASALSVRLHVRPALWMQAVVMEQEGITVVISTPLSDRSKLTVITVCEHTRRHRIQVQQLRHCPSGFTGGFILPLLYVIIDTSNQYEGRQS